MSFLSIERAARTVGCSHRHLLRLIQHNHLRAITVNGKRFIVACELHEWMRRTGRTGSETARGVPGRKGQKSRETNQE